MSKQDQNEYLSLLYEALGEPIGLLVRTSDRERARQKLYAARREADDEALSVLQIRISPFADGEQNDLIIVKSKVSIPLAGAKELGL